MTSSGLKKPELKVFDNEDEATDAVIKALARAECEELQGGFPREQIRASHDDDWLYASILVSHDNGDDDVTEWYVTEAPSGLEPERPVRPRRPTVSPEVRSGVEKLFAMLAESSGDDPESVCADPAFGACLSRLLSGVGVYTWLRRESEGEGTRVETRVETYPSRLEAEEALKVNLYGILGDAYMPVKDKGRCTLLEIGGKEYVWERMYRRG